MEKNVRDFVMISIERENLMENLYKAIVSFEFPAIWCRFPIPIHFTQKINSRLAEENNLLNSNAWVRVK